MGVSDSEAASQQEHQQQAQQVQEALTRVSAHAHTLTSDLHSRGQEMDVFLKQELREDVPTGGLLLLAMLGSASSFGLTFLVPGLRRLAA